MMAENTTPKPKNPEPEIDTNADGTVVKDDLLDAGVPMLPGDPSEPVGPEDAIGVGPKRGDYTDRIDSGPHLVSERIPNAKPGEPHTRLVPAAERAEDIGDVKGKKGGVDTVPAPRA